MELKRLINRGYFQLEGAKPPPSAWRRLSTLNAFRLAGVLVFLVVAALVVVRQQTHGQQGEANALKLTGPSLPPPLLSAAPPPWPRLPSSTVPRPIFRPSTNMGTQPLALIPKPPTLRQGPVPPLPDPPASWKQRQWRGPLATITECQQDGQPALCITAAGQPTVSTVPPPGASSISCANQLTNNLLLAALELDYARIIVHQPRHQLLPIHQRAAHLADVVFANPRSGSLSAVWAASPATHRRFFQAGCDLLAERRQREGKNDSVPPTLDDFFFALSYGAAFFPVNPELDEPPAQPREAYVTYLSSQSHDWYVESVRLMNYKLRQLCPGSKPRDFVAMVLRPGTGGGNGTSSASSSGGGSSRQASEPASEPPYASLLRQEGMVVVVVDDIDTPYNRPGRFVGIWAKQRFWQLTQYDVVAFIDPDQVLVRCPDAVFSYPPWSHDRVWHFVQAADGSQRATGNPFSSGIMLVQPSLEHMAAVEELARTSGQTNDQTLSTHYFANRGFELPEYYSFWKRHAWYDPQEWEVFKHCSSFLHYTGEKPWELPVAPGTLPAVLRFFVEYQQFKQAVSAGPIFSLPFSAEELAGAEQLDPAKCPLEHL